MKKMLASLHRKNKILIACLLVTSWALPTWSQQENVDLVGEEQLADEITPEERLEQEEAIETGDVTLFGRIDPFDDVVVLQRRFLPKKNRFESSLSLGFLADNPFFVTTIYYLRTSFSFSEDWGVELSYFNASTSESQVTEDLLEQGDVASSISSVPEQFYGVDVKWTPIYGKLAFWNQSIVPIDNYYLLGAGQTTLSDDESPLTIHAATGLTFGIQRWLAARVELGFYRYSTDESGSFTDTHFNIGLSAFFPGASYR